MDQLTWPHRCELGSRWSIVDVGAGRLAERVACRWCRSLVLLHLLLQLAFCSQSQVAKQTGSGAACLTCAASATGVR
jgi:hypothetical protein